MVKIDLDDLIEAAETYDMEIVITVTGETVSIGGKKWIHGSYYGDYLRMPATQILYANGDVDQVFYEFIEDLAEKLKEDGR